MYFKRLLGPALSLAAGLALAACGGGSSSGGGSTPPPAASPPPPPAPTSVNVVGTITGFGSIYVNGARYEVASDTVVSIEDQAEIMGDDSALRLGMKVEVEAEDDNGNRTARRIEFDEDLKGPIETITPDALDPTIGTFVVIGQTVVVDANTMFDDDIGNNDGVAGIDFRDLAVGMVVEISGFPNDNGVLATRVDRQLDGAGNDPGIGDPNVVDDELEIKGFVEAVAADNTSITVNGVVFLVDAATVFEDGLLLNADLVGAFVEVKADIVGNDYVAVSVEPEDDFDDDDRNGEFEIEGVLQAVNTMDTPNTFTINGITVPVTDASSLEAFVGQRIEVKGGFNADGVLVLSEAHPDVEDTVRSEDNVAMVDVNALNFTTRLGLVVTPTGDSRVEDDAGEGDGDHLTPAEFINRLQIGDRMEVRGFENADATVTWTRIERDELAAENDDFECELRGPVSAVNGDAAAFDFVIQGVTVMTGSVDEDDFKDEMDLAIGKAAFFDRLQVGDVVEAESEEGDAFCMTGMLDAREVEFEPADDDGSDDD
ncbi:MAG: hypothetical protein KJO31_05650 [Gammaproteobacteria bacterium]|nr:hypothetical protein [Gammaproteobacteria bacterium]